MNKAINSFSLKDLAEHLTTAAEDRHGINSSPSGTEGSASGTDGGEAQNSSFFDQALFGGGDKDFDAGIWSPGSHNPSRATSANGPHPILDLTTSNEEITEAACRDAVKFGIIRLFVHNLPDGTRWQDLKDHFSRFGNVQYASVYVNPENNENLAYGFVVMSNVAETIAVLRYDKPHYINGCRGMVVELFRSGNGKYSNGYWSEIADGIGGEPDQSGSYRRRQMGGDHMYPESSYRQLPPSYNNPPAKQEGRGNKFIVRKGSKYSADFVSDDFDFEQANNEFKRSVAIEKAYGNLDSNKKASPKQENSFFDAFDTVPTASRRPFSSKTSRGVQQPFACSNFNNRIMVSNMSLDTEWRDIKSFFEQFGPVKFVYLETGYSANSFPGDSLLSGYVEMVNEDDAVTLLSYEGTFFIKNTAVEVRPFDGTAKPDVDEAIATCSKLSSGRFDQTIA